MSKLTPEQIAEMKGRLLIARDLARKDSDDAAVWMADAFLKVFAHIAAVEAERDAGLVAFKATDDTANQWLERALAEKVRADAAEAALAAREVEVGRLREIAAVSVVVETPNEVCDGRVMGPLSELIVQYGFECLKWIIAVPDGKSLTATTTTEPRP